MTGDDADGLIWFRPPSGEKCNDSKTGERVYLAETSFGTRKSWITIRFVIFSDGRIQLEGVDQTDWKMEKIPT